MNAFNVIYSWYDTCATPRAENASVSHVLGIGGNSGAWILRDTYGTCSLTRQQMAAHEAGHLMGFINRYGAGGAYNGWGTNIMGVSTQNPEQRTYKSWQIITVYD